MERENISSTSTTTGQNDAFLRIVETLEAKVVTSHSSVFEDGVVIKLTKLNKIGGHSVIYKCQQYVIKELNGEDRVYNTIINKHIDLNQYLPKYMGTVELFLNGTLQSYIVLEDLTHGLLQPFVIDLKMGTRQYGLNSSDKKIHSQKLKCRNLTSLCLGTRLCGLQIVNKSGAFELYDKYYGRTLDRQQFLCNLIRFVNNRLTYSMLVKCLVIIMHLQRIYDLVGALDHFRLYGTSILMIYDNINDGEVVIKLIDFSKSFIVLEAEFEPLQLSHPKDVGFLKGVYSLIQLFKFIFESISGIKMGDTDVKGLMAEVKQKESQFLDTWTGQLQYEEFSFELDDLTSD